MNTACPTKSTQKTPDSDVTQQQAHKATPHAVLTGPAPEDFVPTTEAEMEWCLRSWRWRVLSGQLYKILTKNDDDDVGEIVQFKPNAEQRDFVENLHYRNVILKARQLGMTTMSAIMWLDHALFVTGQRVGIIAHTQEDAEVIFRDKVIFAYENLPPEILEMFPTRKQTETTLYFAHNSSSIRVATSMRGGTIHRLHVSELGKIGVKYPAKAEEIIRGSIPSVPGTGIVIIESTAEGRSGAFFDYATRAEAKAQMGKTLDRGDFRFFFYSWWQHAGYRSPANDNTPVSATDHEYFDGIENEMCCKIDLRQRKWYVSKRENEMNGDPERMWQENPSTPAECWMQSTAGTFFAPQLSRARSEGRIGRYPFITNVPVHTFWDIGAGDGTAIWLMQYVGSQHRFPLFIEDWAQSYEFFVSKLMNLGVVFGTHYLPHDASHQRQMQDRVASPQDLLSELAPSWNFEIVPRVQFLQNGIDLLRSKFNQAYFDEVGCKEGLNHVSLYHKKWNSRLGLWSNEPEKGDGHSEAADALRQWAQGFDPATALTNSYAAIKKVRRSQPQGGMAS
jgi:hypothetical protein